MLTDVYRNDCRGTRKVVRVKSEGDNGEIIAKLLDVIVQRHVYARETSLGAIECIEYAIKHDIVRSETYSLLGKVAELERIAGSDIYDAYDALYRQL